jgi:predicted permease
MNIFQTTFESVAVLLGIGIIGFYIIRKKVIPGIVLRSLSPLALEIGLPSLIFVNILTDFSPQEYPNWWHLPIWWVFFTAVAALFTFFFMFLSKRSSRREFALCLFYQNAIFFPLAILTGMFQPAEPYVISLFLFTLFNPAFFFGTYPFFFKEREKDNTHIPLSKLFHPSFIATIFAIIIVLIGIQTYVPDIAISILSLLGGMTVPILMIILGGNVFNDLKGKGTIQINELLKFVIVKNFIFPLLFIGILFVLKPYISYSLALIILLQSAVPPLTAIPIVTERLKGNSALASQLLVGSFLVSLISIPTMVSIFSMVYSSS